MFWLHTWQDILKKWAMVPDSRLRQSGINKKTHTRSLLWEIIKLREMLMVKAEQTRKDVCLVMLANYNTPSWKWKWICSWVIIVLRGPLLIGQLHKEQKGHQLKQETWPEQRIQKPIPLHSVHWMNITTKRNHKRQWHKNQWFIYTSCWWAEETKPKTSTK